jgi:hypothetical protein
MKPKIIERGWAGHFICAERCLFRRNTLIDWGGKKKIIVSTVGLMRDIHKENEFDTIGAGGRYYETMAFHAKKRDEYWDIDVSKQIYFNSEWAICAEAGWRRLPKGADNLANDMHERVVKELSKRYIAAHGEATEGK